MGSCSSVRLTVWNPKWINFGVGFRVMRFLKELLRFQQQSFLTRWEGHTGRIRCSVWPQPSACCYLRFVGMAASSWWCTIDVSLWAAGRAGVAPAASSFCLYSKCWFRCWQLRRIRSLGRLALRNHQKREWGFPTGIQLCLKRAGASWTGLMWCCTRLRAAWC